MQKYYKKLLNLSKIKKTVKKKLLFRSKKKMKNIISLLLLFFTFCIFISCNKSVVFEEKVIFPNTNWSFENKAITFKVPIKGSDKPYAVFLELELSGAPNVDMFHATFTLITPKGGKTIKPLMFNFKSPQEPYITSNSNIKIYRLTAYPKKYFYETGDYSFEVNQFSNKADNYGIHSLNLRVVKVKE